MGRPSVDSEAVKVRFQRPTLERIDAFASEHEVNRPEAVRRLVEKALDSI